MKKLMPLILLIALLCAGCGGQASSRDAHIDTVPEILSQEEYVLYQNVFHGDYGPQLTGKEVVKRGVLAAVQDAFNDRTRYYVWGYMDATRCCDWQWELVPEDLPALPPTGSLVNVRGTFAASDDALDGYWIENAAVEAESTYTGPTAELDMCAMSCTLERVQMLNILYQSDYFEGKAFAAYGRIAGPGTLENPYYDGSWQIGFSSEDTSPAIGTQVVLRGTVAGGALTDCTVTAAG